MSFWFLQIPRSPLHQQLDTKKSLSHPIMLLLLLILLFLSPPPFTLSLTQDGLFLYDAKLQLFNLDNALSDWNPRDATPCNWFGVTSDPSFGDVTSLNLTNAQLYGPFLTILCRLPSLAFLFFYNNLINFSLPTDISNCSHFQVLNLSQNTLVCPIPETLSQIPSLRHLANSTSRVSGIYEK